MVSGLKQTRPGHVGKRVLCRSRVEDSPKKALNLIRARVSHSQHKLRVALCCFGYYVLHGFSNVEQLNKIQTQTQKLGEGVFLVCCRFCTSRSALQREAWLLDDVRRPRRHPRRATAVQRSCPAATASRPESCSPLADEGAPRVSPRSHRSE